MHLCEINAGTFIFNYTITNAVKLMTALLPTYLLLLDKI